LLKFPVFAALLVLVALAWPPLASAQLGQVKATHGAWQVNCAKPPGKKVEKCALVQSVTAEDRPNVGLTVMFLKTVDGDRQLLRIVAPLGVLLPAGLGLKIDDADIGQAPFIKCGKIGCVSEVVVKDDLIAKLKAGKTAIFVIFQTPESGIGIPISLEGFTAGLGAVK
jgi:invasion protein IalB